MVDWMIYDDAHQAFICKAHGYAITNLAGRLTDTHSDVDLKSRKAIVAEYLGLEINRPQIINFNMDQENQFLRLTGSPSGMDLRVRIMTGVDI